VQQQVCSNVSCNKPFCPEHSSVDLWEGEQLLNPLGHLATIAESGNVFVSTINTDPATYVRWNDLQKTGTFHAPAERVPVVQEI